MIEAIGGIGAPAREAVPLLAGMLENEDSELRKDIIDALGRIDGRAAARALLDLLRAGDSLSEECEWTLEDMGEEAQAEAKAEFERRVGELEAAASESDASAQKALVEKTSELGSAMEKVASLEASLEKQKSEAAEAEAAGAAASATPEERV